MLPVLTVKGVLKVPTVYERKYLLDWTRAQEVVGNTKKYVVIVRPYLTDTTYLTRLYTLAMI